MIHLVKKTATHLAAGVVLTSRESADDLPPTAWLRWSAGHKKVGPDSSSLYIIQYFLCILHIYIYIYIRRIMRNWSRIFKFAGRGRHAPPAYDLSNSRVCFAFVTAVPLASTFRHGHLISQSLVRRTRGGEIVDRGHHLAAFGDAGRRIHGLTAHGFSLLSPWLHA